MTKVAPALPAPTLQGWGRVPEAGRELLGEDLVALTQGAQLCRGLGRSYGDSSLPARPTDRVINTRMADRILAFDPRTGVLRAEAGLSLAEMNRLFVPRGWFTPVTPGTKFVTLGGMVASDVHGKNHHVAGCFGAHVRALRIRLADEAIVDCSPTVEPDLFYGTIGGMGLLGHVLEVEVQLAAIPSQWIWMETERVPNLDAYLAGLDAAAKAWPMTMGWIDVVSRGRSQGRGILMAGRWATADEVGTRGAPRQPLQLSLPVTLPLVNGLTTRLFNFAYYRKEIRRFKRRIVSPEPFFYPLDAVLHWNRSYGARGFTQHQSVLPRAAGAEAVRELLRELARLGGASFLTVIKDCGDEGKGVLSFPLAGTSLAVDLGISADTQKIVDRLNEVVIAAGGRIYLTKDRFTRAADYARMDPRLPRFLALRDKYDPQRRLRSAQSVRLFGDRP